jgi:probable rRNA maturation factor
MSSKSGQPHVLISSSQKAVRVPRKEIVKLVAFVAAAEGTRVAEVDLAVVSGGEIAALNRRYLRHAGVTDVLSFDLSGPPGGGISAQIVVCGDEAVRQARMRGQPPRRELLLYIVHGLLHLMGYEDQSIRGSAKMHAREEKLLSCFLWKK